MSFIEFPAWGIPNNPALNQSERTAFSSLQNFLLRWRNLLNGGNLDRVFTFQHKQEGLDFMATRDPGNNGLGVPGDSFISLGGDGTGTDGDTGEGSLWIYANDTDEWLVWDFERVVYTPTYTGLTVGTGSAQTTFLREGRFATLDFNFTQGASGGMGSFSAIEVPLDANSPLDYDLTAVVTGNTNSNQFGHCEMQLGGSAFVGQCRIESSTTWRCLRTAVSGSNVANAAITAALPAVWANGDVIGASIRYPLAI